MRSITQEEFREMRNVIIVYGKLRYAIGKKQYLAVIDEVNFHQDGICAIVTGEVQTLSEEGWVPALENCPAFHRFRFTLARPRWVEEESLETEVIQIDIDDGPIYIMFSAAAKGSEAWTHGYLLGE